MSRRTLTPNRLRFSLNLKGLKYKTVWVEFPDIEALYKQLGLEPTSTREPKYTLPVIHDPSTNKAISDSMEIARYLDATYPATTLLFPPGSEAFQGIGGGNAFESLRYIMLPITCASLNPVSEAYYRRTREARYGKRLEELSPIGSQREEHWKQVQEAFGVVASLLEGKKFVLGDTISFADVTIASGVLGVKRTFGAQSQEWKDIEEWNGGRWPTYIAQFAEYEKVIV